MLMSISTASGETRRPHRDRLVPLQADRVSYPIIWSSPDAMMRVDLVVVHHQHARAAGRRERGGPGLLVDAGRVGVGAAGEVPEFGGRKGTTRKSQPGGGGDAQHREPARTAWIRSMLAGGAEAVRALIRTSVSTSTPSEAMATARRCAHGVESTASAKRLDGFELVHVPSEALQPAAQPVRGLVSPWRTSAEHPWASGVRGSSRTSPSQVSSRLNSTPALGTQRYSTSPPSTGHVPRAVTRWGSVGSAGSLLEFECGEQTRRSRHRRSARPTRRRRPARSPCPASGPGPISPARVSTPASSTWLAADNDAVDAAAERLGVAGHAVRRAAVVEVELEASQHRTRDHGPCTQREEFAEIEGLDTHGVDSGHLHNGRVGTPSPAVAASDCNEAR